MKYLSLALLIILYSCQKTDTSTNIVTPPPTVIDSTTTLGIQKDIFGTTVHTWGNRIEANNNRIFFAFKRNSTGADEFYATDVKDSAYQLQPFFSGSLRLDRINGSFCLKANGDIFVVMDKYTGAAQDSLIFLLNKANTNSWQVIKRGLRDVATWGDHYCFGCATAPTNVFGTPSGRLVMVGSSKVIVSDDNGLNWRQTFTTPFAGGIYEGAVFTNIGSRNFISAADGILYSDNDFETGTYKLVDYGTFIYRKVIKLDDGRLLINSSPFGIYQSLNNGQSWSHYLPTDPSDSLNTYSNSYFAFISGTTFRVRALYKPCNAYMTVDISPNAFFKFYPLPKLACPITNQEEVIASVQRPDKRTYYVRSTIIGTIPFVGIYRDY